MKATGTKTDKQHERDGDDRRGDLAHRQFCGVGRSKLGMLLHDALDVLNHHNRVVDDDTDGEHDRKQ